MYNWSTDTVDLKGDEEKYAVWHLEQTVNFGLGGERINRVELLKYWKLLQLDRKKKDYLALLLWPKPSSPTIN